MSRHITLQPHLTSAALEQRYRVAKEPNERTWWPILWLLSQGRSGREVATVTGYSPYWIGQIAKRSTTEGPAGMRNRRHTTSHRAPPALTLAQQEELRATLAAAVARGERWTGSDVATWISERLGRLVAYSLGYAYLIPHTSYLKRLKHSQQLPRPHHVQADPVAQQQFKKS
jgi:winged helix-turn-helix protein